MLLESKRYKNCNQLVIFLNFINCFILRKNAPRDYNKMTDISCLCVYGYVINTLENFIRFVPIMIRHEN